MDEQSRRRFRALGRWLHRRDGLGIGQQVQLVPSPSSSRPTFYLHPSTPLAPNPFILPSSPLRSFPAAFALLTRPPGRAARSRGGAVTEERPVHPPEHQRELFVGAPPGRMGGGGGRTEPPSLAEKRHGDICSGGESQENGGGGERSGRDELSTDLNSFF